MVSLHMNRVSFVLYETGKFLSEAVSKLKKFKLSGRFLEENGFWRVAPRGTSAYTALMATKRESVMLKQAKHELVETGEYREPDERSECDSRLSCHRLARAPCGQRNKEVGPPVYDEFYCDEQADNEKTRKWPVSQNDASEND